MKRRQFSELFDFFPQAGIFIWRVNRSRVGNSLSSTSRGHNMLDNPPSRSLVRAIIYLLGLPLKIYGPPDLYLCVRPRKDEMYY